MKKLPFLDPIDPKDPQSNWTVTFSTDIWKKIQNQLCGSTNDPSNKRQVVKQKKNHFGTQPNAVCDVECVIRARRRALNKTLASLEQHAQIMLRRPHFTFSTWLKIYIFQIDAGSIFSMHPAGEPEDMLGAGEKRANENDYLLLLQHHYYFIWGPRIQQR